MKEVCTNSNYSVDRVYYGNYDNNNKKVVD